MGDILDRVRLSKTMRSRIGNALMMEGIETVGQMRAYLDERSYIDSTGERQYLAAIYRLHNIGAVAGKHLQDLLKVLL